MKKVADYDFIETLHGGNFSYVYIVQPKDDVKKYVIKQEPYYNQYIDDIKNEVAIMKKLNHPNIIKFYDHWCEGELSFILMEYGEISLCDLVTKYEAEGRSLMTEESSAEVLNYFVQITLAVNYMHRQGIMHRDLDPEAVVLREPHKTVKIIDFNISIHVSSEDQFTYYIRNDCAAPEMRNDYFTFKCDIWSIGAILCFLMDHSLPDNLKDKLEKLEQFPGIIKNISKKVLIISPGERPDSYEILHFPELKEALKNYYETLDSAAKDVVAIQIEDIIQDDEVER